MNCSEVKKIVQLYLDNELDACKTLEAQDHLESCPSCLSLLEAYSKQDQLLRECASAQTIDVGRLRESVRAAIRTEPMTARYYPPPSHTLLRVALRRPAASLAIAACLLLTVAFALRVTQRQHATHEIASRRESSKQGGADGPRGSSGSIDEESALRATMAEMSRAAAGDHRDCAITFRLLEKPLPLGEAGLKFDRAYLDLAEVVKSRLGGLSGGLELVESHSCVFSGRRFAHLVLRERGRLISLLVTDLSRSVDFGRDALTDEVKTAMACSQSEGYQVACFKTARHAVFVVSELAEGENLAVARLLAPAVYDQVSHVEGSG